MTGEEEWSVDPSLSPKSVGERILLRQPKQPNRGSEADSASAEAGYGAPRVAEYQQSAQFHL